MENLHPRQLGPICPKVNRGKLKMIADAPDLSSFSRGKLYADRQSILILKE